MHPFRHHALDNDSTFATESVESMASAVQASIEV